MSKMKRLLILMALAAVVWRAGAELREVSYLYAQEALVKESLASYRTDASQIDAEVEASAAEYPRDGEITAEAGPAEAGPAEAGPAEASPTEASLTEASPTETGPAEDVVVNQNIAALQNEVNEDIIGWLTIPGTQIDYPFVGATDNRTYLERDVYGNQAKAGTLFADRRCGKGFSRYNTIIYGHHMKNGSMFGELKRFADRDFFEANRTGEIMAIDNTYTLEIFAYMVVRADDATVYGAARDREGFYEYVKQKARNYREPDRERNIATLSTCAYEFEDARIVLLATMVPER